MSKVPTNKEGIGNVQSSLPEVNSYNERMLGTVMKHMLTLIKLGGVVHHAPKPRQAVLPHIDEGSNVTDAMPDVRHRFPFFGCVLVLGDRIDWICSVLGQFLDDCLGL